jgi:hypothetical protein
MQRGTYVSWRAPTLILLTLALAACGTRWKTNEDYLDYLASIVLKYQSKHGNLPGGFETAHKDSGITLPNRGDKFGNSLAYYQFENRAFMFRSYGTNQKDDLGHNDDLDLYYLDGKKVKRVDMMAAVRTMPDFRWEVPSIFGEEK